jgi:polyhydroxyalkanoate synthesis regulator phasin
MVIEGLGTGLTHVSRQLDALHAQGVDRTQNLAASISALSGSAGAMTEALKTGDAMATSAISTTEHLLIALDAAAREIDETLPDALARLDARISDSRRVVGDAKPELLALVTAAESTHDAIEAIAQVIAGQRDTLDKLSGKLLETLNSGRTKAEALGEMVEETIGHTNRFADEAAPKLVEALLRVRDTASAAADRARETLATVIPEAALALENASAEAMRRASSVAVEQQIAELVEAGEMAAEAAQRTSERLTRQMLAIADSTAVVESRIEEARAEREEADQNTFARRVSLLIESLNSASIDITKSFSTEVSDSAWSAYLKGDRGVFTRRAVRLLDAGEAREIARLYDDDPAFREQVNRYIHDFEAMLRAILAQRDGSPLGVTLLSSDMGKLYVALAQAIERLRT